MPQHVAALERAQVIRIERARLRWDLKRRRAHLADLLEDELFATLQVGYLLESLPAQRREHVNRRTRPKATFLARRILARVAIPANRPVGMLTRRQRELILETAEELVPGGCP